MWIMKTVVRLFIGVLNGSFLFMADLVKRDHDPCEIAFIRVSSYEGTASTGSIKEAFGLPDNLQTGMLSL